MKRGGEMKDSDKYLEWKKKIVSEMRQEEYDRAMKNWTLSKDLLDSLEKLQPYGKGNPEPYFIISDLKIDSIKMVGVADPLGILWGDYVPEVEETSFWAKALGTAVGMGILIAIPVTIFIMIFAAVEPPKHLNQEEFILDALLDSGNK